MTSTDSLIARGVGVTYAGLRALHRVDLAVTPGQVVGLIGPNGAGKTTMVNVLSGFQLPSMGSVSLGDRLLNGGGAHVFRRVGIARTFQAGRLFRQLDVIENLAIAAAALGARRAQARAQAWAMLEGLDLQALAHRQAGALPYTDERRVAIARALMGNPRFVLLDEPAAGMSEHEAAGLATMVRAMAAERGCGVLLIEHNVRMVLESCQHIVVLDSGQVIDAGTPAHIQASDVVRHAYMGTVTEVGQEVEAALG
ncbi:MAG TPA: ATP-binding cassette domain-containing protein [Burkholderiaceae bacterium]|nr:ATP-binding cassette domain-containing protein [Burkholderiaceae bacterium]